MKSNENIVFKFRYKSFPFQMTTFLGFPQFSARHYNIRLFASFNKQHSLLSVLARLMFIFLFFFLNENKIKDYYRKTEKKKTN